MTTGTPANLILTPAGTGLGNRAAPGTGWGAHVGGHVGVHGAPAVRAAALPRPGVSSSTPAAACCTAARVSALARGGGPPRALSATLVPAVQRSDAATG
jgi:hypothetical protein